MRTALYLSIFVFISTLFWPQLPDKHLILFALAVSLLLLFLPKLRILVIIPMTALYFTCYVSLILTGQLLPSAQLDHNGLDILVDGKDHTIIVQIVSLISENNKGYFRAKLIEFDNNQLKSHFDYSPLIEMRWYKPTLLVQAGQIHRFVVRLKPVYGRANPAGFDRQKWSYSEHIAYQATIKAHLMRFDEKNTLRAIFYQKVQSISADLKHQGLLLALSFADKSLISRAQKQQIRNLGISHLFAISGLHIGLFFSVLYLLAQSLFNGLLPASKIGWFSLRLINVSALIGAFSYAYLAGFSLPTQRAFLMLLVAVFVFMLKRNIAKVDLLLLVLATVIFWDPLSVLSLSLWLSFGAVMIILGLLWAFPTISIGQLQGKNRRKKNKFIHYLKLLFFLQIGLTLLMLPLQLVSFSAVSLVAILINLLAIPLFSLLIIPLVLLATLITLFYSPLALFLFVLCDQLLSYFFTLSLFLNDSYYWFSLAQEKLLLTLWVLLILLLVVHFQSMTQRKISYFFSVFLLCLLSLRLLPKEATWFVEVIDVGQGLAVLVRSEDHVLLYDTGARYPSGFNMVDSEILPYLTSMGINKLDHLVISHSDIDHAGGADRIADKLKVIARWAGEPLTSSAYFTPCLQGQKWTLAKLKIEVLSPITLTNNNNNNSCVLRISDGKTSLLLTGDIGTKQEKILVRQFGDKLNSTILLAPHHGSRYSSSIDFIDAVSPQWVAFSAGFMNHWGFPTDEVLKRYQSQAVKMVNTGQSGFIRFQITAQAIKMQTFREDLAAYWYHHSLIP
ncbi:MAG: DNA internalization-related competence protein ComEC/Rec2 [Psychromonas sp.]